MGVSLWRWTKVCDTHMCIGDCDRCSYDNVLSEDTDLIKMPSGVYINKPMQSFMLTWIPCKNSLPEEVGYYLVTLVKDAEVDIAYFTKYHTWETFQNAEVIAWADLPKPYRRGEE